MPINSIPRHGGDFMWKQAHKFVANPNIKTIWMAQFDEADEGTAIFKATAATSQLPAEGKWLALDADGQSVPSDWYLRLAGEAQKMLEGMRSLKSTIPISPQDPPPCCWVVANNATGVDDGTSQHDVDDGTSQHDVDKMATFRAPNALNTSRRNISGTSQHDVDEGTSQHDVDVGTSQHDVDDGISQQDVDDGTSQLIIPLGLVLIAIGILLNLIAFALVVQIRPKAVNAASADTGVVTCDPEENQSLPSPDQFKNAYYSVSDETDICSSFDSFKNVKGDSTLCGRRNANDGINMEEP
jgi:hypothetical protein